MDAVLRSLSIYQTDLTELTSALFDRANGGLFNLHCASNIGYGEGPNTAAEPKDKYDTIVSNDDMDVYIRKVADALTKIDTKLFHRAEQDEQLVPIPINGYMQGISYPNEKGSCRPHNYPNLDLLYQACEVAKVDCSHVFLYRNPYGFIKSNCHNRRFNPTVLGAIHLYTNLLQVISIQVWMHPERNEGCLGFFDYYNTNDEDHHKRRRDHLKDRVQTLFGWRTSTNPDDFDAYMERTLQNHTTAYTQEEMDAIVPPKYKPAMDSLIRMQNNVVSLCYEQYEQNRIRLMDSH